jgi:MYXO-CTERM domain-containing protein
MKKVTKVFAALSLCAILGLSTPVIAQNDNDRDRTETRTAGDDDDDDGDEGKWGLAGLLGLLGLLGLKRRDRDNDRHRTTGGTVNR